jgi:salicylate hydroxylase
VNYVAFARREEWTEDGWTVPATVDEVMAEFADATREITNIIENTPPERCFKWGLLGREPLPEWTVGRATLLGDAAHPMLPFLGQGAGMAIEDAVILSRVLASSGNPFEGYRRYEAARVERANRVALGSRHAALRINGVIDEKTAVAAAYFDEGEVSRYDPVSAEV